MDIKFSLDSDDILVPYFSTVTELFTGRTFKGQPKRQIEELIGYLEPGDEVYAYAYVCKRHEGKNDVTEKDIIWLNLDAAEYERCGGLLHYEDVSRRYVSSPVI